MESGDSRARALASLKARPEWFLATVQIGITVVGATAAAFGGASMAERLAEVFQQVPYVSAHAEDVALAAVIALVSYLSIVIGELVPKSLALHWSEGYALFAARPFLALSIFAKPLVWFLTASSNLVLRPFGDRTSFTESRFSPEELQQLVEEAAKTGSVDSRAGEIASRALAFGQLTVAQVMVPRNRIRGIPVDATAEDIRRIFLEEGFSRLPVYKGTLDDIVGYISAKDVLAMVWERQLIVLQDLIRPAHFVPEMVPAAQVLHEMQERGSNLAIAVDEHGGVAGLVTLEDLLEELVGELFSEHRPPEELIRREPDGSAVIHGHAPIRDVNRALSLDLPEGDTWDTIAGLAIALSDGIPAKGTIIRLDGASST